MICFFNERVDISVDGVPDRAPAYSVVGGLTDVARGDERMTTVERYVPGVASLRTYERRWLRSDLVAGIVLAAILVPRAWPMPSSPGCRR